VNYRAAATTGQSVTFEAYYPRRSTAGTSCGCGRRRTRCRSTLLDITARRAAQAELQRAARRARLVADVTTDLSDTLVAEQAVARLASCSCRSSPTSPS
jgi:hypothetical protein